MSDQTPRMPELWWDAKYGLLELDGGIVWIHLYNRESLRHRLGQQNPSFNPPLPADAVKLGPVEALRAEVEHWRSAYERLFAVGETRGTKLDEICTVLDAPWPADEDFTDDQAHRLLRIRTIAERETPRESPEEGSPSAIAAEELAALTRPKATAARTMLEEAAILVINSQHAAVSFVQRKLRVGFGKAGQLVEQLHELGVVGPSGGGSKARTVLVPASKLPGVLERIRRNAQTDSEDGR